MPHNCAVCNEFVAHEIRASVCPGCGRYRHDNDTCNFRCCNKNLAVIRRMFSYMREDYPRPVRVKLAAREVRRMLRGEAKNHTRDQILEYGESWVAQDENERYCEGKEAARFEEMAYGYD